MCTTYCTLCGHTAQSNIRDFDIWCFGVLNASTGFVKLSCSRGCFAERACCCAFIQTHTRHQAASATFIIFCVSYVSDTSRVYFLCVMHIIKSTEREQKTWWFIQKNWMLAWIFFLSCLSIRGWNWGERGWALLPQAGVRMFALQHVTDPFFCDLSAITSLKKQELNVLTAPQLSYCHILYLSYLLAK